MPCDRPPLLLTTLPSTLSAFQWANLLLTGEQGRWNKNEPQRTNPPYDVWKYSWCSVMDKFNKSDNQSLKLTHSEICCFSSPLSDCHQCQGAISKGAPDISLGIGATVVLRNAASRPFFSPRSYSSVGCRKRDFTAASEPCLQLARASIVWENANAGSECFQWKTARIVQACIGLKGGGSSLPHHPFHCSHPYSSSGLSVCSSTQDWQPAQPMAGLLSSGRHVPTPSDAGPQKIEFSPLLRLFWRSTIKYGSPFTHSFQRKVTKVKWLKERTAASDEELRTMTFSRSRRGAWRT